MKMIQINELRFNNWVLDGFGNPIQILDIISEGNTSGYKLATLFPIPISPEILDKAGFNRNMEGWYLSAYDKLYDPLEMNGVGAYSQRNTTIFAYKQGEHILRRGIRFVHELQNIHFALTGQELTINLK